MLDMQSGLRWLQREAEAFGGDPDRITIHGQCACMHLLPPRPSRPQPSHVCLSYDPPTTLPHPSDA